MAQDVTVRLRAHHLLCMPAYIGRGYSPAFTANYDGIVARIAAGETLMVVDGPDDICAPLMGEAEPHCLRAGVRRRDARAAGSLTRLLGRPIEPGIALEPDTALIARLRQAFASGRTRKACVGCQWSRLCSSIAAGGFAEARLPVAGCDI